jgi:hypothetical protein
MRFNHVEVFQSKCRWFENENYELHTYADFFELLKNPNDIENIHILTVNFQLKSLKDALQFGLAKTNILKINSSMLDYAYFLDWLQSPDFPFFKVSLIFEMDVEFDRLFEIMKTPNLNLKIFEFDCQGLFPAEFVSFYEGLTQHPCYLRKINLLHSHIIKPGFILDFNKKLRLQEIFKILLAAKMRNSEISKIAKLPKELIRMIQSVLII